MAANPERDGPSGDPPYVAALGLREGPFDTVRGSASFYYKDPAILQRFNLLRHLIQSTGLLVVVQAPEGAGKTTLLEQLQAHADESWHVQRLGGETPPQGIAALYAQLAGALAGVEPVPADGEAIRAVLARLREDARLPVILADDAHLLPVPVLEALISLAYPPAPGAARVVLFAEPSLQVTLEGMALPAELRKSLHIEALPPFTPDQTTAYLMHRLLAAGLSGDDPFTSRQVRQIHRAAGGLPGRIQEQAHRLLLGVDAQGARANRSTALHLRSVLGFLALAGAVAVGLIGVQGPLGRWLAGRAGAPGGAVPPAPVVRMRPARVAGPTAATSPVPLTARIPVASPSTGAAPPAATSPSGHSPAQPSPPAGTVAPVPAAAGVEEQSRQVVNRLPHGAPPAAPVPNPAVRADVHPSGSAPQPPQPQTAPVPQPPRLHAGAVARVPSRPVGRPSTSVHTAAWLMRQDPHHYTVQVIVVRRRDALLRLLQRHRWVASVAWFPVTGKRDRETLYALVYGVYPSREAAVRAAGTLPRALRSAHPWVRSLASVQTAIRIAGTPGVR
jgi:DamX protein